MTDSEGVRGRTSTEAWHPLAFSSAAMKCLEVKGNTKTLVLQKKNNSVNSVLLSRHHKSVSR